MGLSYSRLRPGPGTGLPASTRSLINLGKVKEDRMLDSLNQNVRSLVAYC